MLLPLPPEESIQLRREPGGDAEWGWPWVGLGGGVAVTAGAPIEPLPCESPSVCWACSSIPTQEQRI